MAGIAIKVDGVSKSFKLPHEKHGSLKTAFVNLFRGSRTYEKQQVLKDISFEVKNGEFFGIVGRNGSGKSTLLKLLAGIYCQDTGHIQINGKLTPFIELGVGFNPELTGRENVFLNGVLLGFTRKEVEAQYKDIVDFAELERFMDQKLKNYSSGMQVRLAFSIAIRANSDILVLDEVLAVGDEAFRQKCLDIFEQYKASGKTVVLVTHDMSIVERFCSQAVLIHEGLIYDKGDPMKIARKYSDMNQENYLAQKERRKIKEKELKEWGFKYRVVDKSGQRCSNFRYNEELGVEMEWANDAIVNIGVALIKQSGEYLFGTNTIVDVFKIKNKKVAYRLKLNISPGTYKLVLGLFGDNEDNALEFLDDAAEIVVTKQEMGWGGLTQLDHRWE